MKSQYKTIEQPTIARFEDKMSIRAVPSPEPTPAWFTLQQALENMGRAL